MVFAKELLRKLVRRVGFEVFAYNHQRIHDLRKAKLLRDLRVSVVLDAGANAGQYGLHLRELGYSGRIVSYEPIPKVFELLQRVAANDPKWEALNLAVGDRDAECEMNVADISEVSSLLRATGASTTGDWTNTTKQPVTARRIESLLREMQGRGDTLYLKLDTQGFEQAALIGAEPVLQEFAAIELEASTVPLYDGETLLPELMQWLASRGFSVFSMDTVVVDHITGRVLQFELLMQNERHRNVTTPGSHAAG